MLLSALISITLSCSVTDGDTLRCGPGPGRSNQPERVRLLGIDAPELPGHCRRGRICAPGNPYASKASLQAALRQGPIRIRRAGYDRYGRTLATVSSGTSDLSCWQLRHRQAIYKPEWDDGGRVKAICPR